jgi:hypothetical protein
MGDAEQYKTICEEIKKIGRAVGGVVGDKLATSAPGGDFRDLLLFLRRAGVGPQTAAKVESLLAERRRLAAQIAAAPAAVEAPAKPEWWRA